MTRTTQETPHIPPEVMARYEAVIGLEVHAQLKTQTKAFCGSSTRFGDPPNSNVCPVCLGLPGALPVLNRRAVELAVRASLALHAKIHERSVFARKNYFYPDLPKGYQISMYELPLATEGWLEIELDGAARRIGITRLHMEEDAAKNLHEGFPDSDRWSYIDFNRCGVPLIEIVSEPDLRTPPEAYAYLNTLKQVLEYTDVSDCNMEEGSLRCDANVSVRLRGAAKLGTKAEVKNLNSFRYLAHALEYEIERQIGVLESGGTITQETRLWNVAGGRTEPMRSKEFAHDYRYFPDPDLLPVTASKSLVDEVRSGMPELPDAKRARFVREHGLKPYNASVLTETRNIADYFEAVVREGADPTLTANWMEKVSHLATMSANLVHKAGGKRGPIAAEHMARLIQLVAENRITATTARDVLKKMVESGQTPEEIIASEGYTQIRDVGAIEEIVRDVVDKNQENLAKYIAGNDGIFNFFVGQVMHGTRGQADVQEVSRVLKEQLKVNHEKAVTDNFLVKFNQKFAKDLVIRRIGGPPDPDIVISEPNGEDEVGVEVTSTYLSPSEAKFAWDQARRTFRAIWLSGVIADPDNEFRRRLSEVIKKKITKTYSTKRTWLVVEFNYWLGDVSDAKMIVESVSRELAKKASPFEAIWAVWQLTNVDTAQYEVFRVI